MLKCSGGGVGDVALSCYGFFSIFLLSFFFRVNLNILSFYRIVHVMEIMKHGCVWRLNSRPVKHFFIFRYLLCANNVYITKRALCGIMGLTHVVARFLLFYSCQILPLSDDPEKIEEMIVNVRR